LAVRWAAALEVSRDESRGLRAVQLISPVIDLVIISCPVQRQL